MPYDPSVINTQIMQSINDLTTRNRQAKEQKQKLDQQHQQSMKTMMDQGIATVEQPTSKDYEEAIDQAGPGAKVQFEGKDYDAMSEQDKIKHLTTIAQTFHIQPPKAKIKIDPAKLAAYGGKYDANTGSLQLDPSAKEIQNPADVAYKQAQTEKEQAQTRQINYATHQMHKGGSFKYINPNTNQETTSDDPSAVLVQFTPTKSGEKQTVVKGVGNKGVDKKQLLTLRGQYLKQIDAMSKNPVSSFMNKGKVKELNDKVSAIDKQIGSSGGGGGGPKEGATATNPDTGETLTYRGGKWQ